MFPNINIPGKNYENNIKIGPLYDDIDDSEPESKSDR
jgi:hypothetical protein